MRASAVCLLLALTGCVAATETGRPRERRVISTDRAPAAIAWSIARSARVSFPPL
mgnify:CR=1 FL=1